MNTISVSTLLQKHKLLQNAPIGQRGVGGVFHHVEQFLPARVLSHCTTLHVMKKNGFLSHNTFEEAEQKGLRFLNKVLTKKSRQKKTKLVGLSWS